MEELRAEDYEVYPRPYVLGLASAEAIVIPREKSPPRARVEVDLASRSGGPEVIEEQTAMYLGRLSNFNIVRLNNVPVVVSPDLDIAIPLQDIVLELGESIDETDLWVRLEGPPDEESIFDEQQEKKFVYANGSVVIDFGGRELEIEGQAVHLTNREFEVLEILVRNEGNVVDSKQIVTEIWGEWFGSRVLNTYISSIRRNLGEYRNLLKTKRWGGYSFDDNSISNLSS